MLYLSDCESIIHVITIYMSDNWFGILIDYMYIILYNICYFWKVLISDLQVPFYIHVLYHYLILIKGNNCFSVGIELFEWAKNTINPLLDIVAMKIKIQYKEWRWISKDNKISEDELWELDQQSQL